MPTEIRRAQPETDHAATRDPNKQPQLPTEVRRANPGVDHAAERQHDPARWLAALKKIETRHNEWHSNAVRRYRTVGGLSTRAALGWADGYQHEIDEKFAQEVEVHKDQSRADWYADQHPERLIAQAMSEAEQAGTPTNHDLSKWTQE